MQCAAYNQKWTQCSCRVHKNADTIEQWGYLHRLMEAISQAGEVGEESWFHLGFHDSRCGVVHGAGQGPRYSDSLMT